MVGASLEARLRGLVDAIVDNDYEAFLRQLREEPELVSAAFPAGATRQTAAVYFLPAIGHYINAGDTALHLAAAAHRTPMVDALIRAGAEVRAKNRRGVEPLHLAAMGNPNSPHWNPEAQTTAMVSLLQAGADPNAKNMDGTTALHRAVRSRCSAAVGVLLEHGADPSIRTKNGSTAERLAVISSGRGGSGSAEALDEQTKILGLFR